MRVSQSDPVQCFHSLKSFSASYLSTFYFSDGRLLFFYIYKYIYMYSVNIIVSINTTLDIVVV